MGRPIRHQSPDTFYFITNRCCDGMFLLRPDRVCCEIVAGCLARAAEIHKVELVCFGFFANHFHLIARFPLLNRDAFMGDVTGQIADRLNKHRGRSGPMFPERYDAQALCDGTVLKDKIAYVLNNPVKDGLVARADKWPGVTSMSAHKTGEAFQGRWLNHREWTKLRRRKTTDHTKDEAMEAHRIELHVPEALDGDTDDERRASLLELVEDDRQRLHDEAEQNLGRPPTFMGRDAVLACDVRDRPANSPVDDRDKTRWRRRRMFVSSEPGGAAARREKHRERTRQHRAALKRMLAGKPHSFPVGTHKPGKARCIGHEEAVADHQAAADG